MSNAAKAEDASPKRRRKLPLIIALVAILAGAGGGGYFWWTKQQAVAAAGSAGADSATSSGDHAADAPHGVLLPLDTFTVNLADTNASRFLRTNVQLVVAVDEAVLKELEHQKVPIVRARAAVLELLAEQTSTAISTPEGKEALKAAIRTRAGKALQHEVADVLFSDFVIQF